MLTLQVTEKGHCIEIPGIPAVRSPANIDITKIDLSLVISVLRKYGIENYKIVSLSETGEKKIFTRRDFVEKNKEDLIFYQRKMDRRIEKMESMISRLLEKNEVNQVVKVEQITKSKYIEGETEPKIEELEDIFIPNIDVGGMEVKGETSKTSIKRGKGDVDDSADLLSRIIQQGK